MHLNSCCPSNLGVISISNHVVFEAQHSSFQCETRIYRSTDLRRYICSITCRLSSDGQVTDKRTRLVPTGLSDLHFKPRQVVVQVVVLQPWRKRTEPAMRGRRWAEFTFWVPG